LGNLTERNRLEHLGIDVKIILKVIFKKMGAWTALIWLRTGTGGRLMRVRE
jgi:hypothetical protein